MVPWKCSSASCHLCADVVLPAAPAPRPPPSEVPRGVAQAVTLSDWSCEVSTAATTTATTAAPEWVSGRVAATQGAWAEVDTQPRLWAWRPRAAPGLLLHGYRRGEELDLRVDLRAAARSGAFVPRSSRCEQFVHVCTFSATPAPCLLH